MSEIKYKTKINIKFIETNLIFIIANLKMA